MSHAQQNLVVDVFRQGAPYIEYHRDSTVVLVLPGSVAASDHLSALLADIALVHNLGVKVVVVLGTSATINKRLVERGEEVRYEGSHRITDAPTLACAKEAAGALRMEVEAMLSAAPATNVFRRHGSNGGAPADLNGSGLQANNSVNDNAFAARIRVAGGNYISAKRRGVVKGVDFGHTGEVRGIDVDGIRQQLTLGSVVLVTNLGHSASGETLNCNCYDVATSIATAIHADKLVCMRDGPVDNGWISSLAARARVDSMQTAGDADQGEVAVVASTVARPHTRSDSLAVDELAALTYAVEGSVRRAHLLDCAVEGALLLELYTRDGVGMMVSSDAYQKMRKATESDLKSIAELLAPLEADGVLVKRSQEDMRSMLPSWRVVEREGLVIACAALLEYDYSGAEGTGEVAAFTVRPSYQGRGVGDRMLARLEAEARHRGISTLYVLTTRTADWFVGKGFRLSNVDDLPPARRESINLVRNSQVYVKQLGDLDEVPSPETPSEAMSSGSYMFP